MNEEFKEKSLWERRIEEKNLRNLHPVLAFPANIVEMTTFDDLVLVETHGLSFWIVLKCRDEFFKCRISKKKYYDLMRNEKEVGEK
jgi:hypothetical protein